MYNLEDGTEWSSAIKQAFKRGLTRAYIKIGNTIIDQSNYLMNTKYKDEKADPETGEFIGVTSMRELTIKLHNADNNLNLENEEVEYHLGAKVGNEYKYINYGKFIVQKPNNEEVNEEMTFTALDYMCKFDVDEPYDCQLVFPSTLGLLAEDVCRQVGVTLGDSNFRNADKAILANPFVNGENPRTVLKSIAKLSFSCGYIGQDNKLYFSFDVNNSTVDEEITTDEYFENKPNDEVKPISAITLRSSEIKASGQTIYDEDLIDEYGVNELIIEEDYIAYTDTLRNTFLNGARSLFGLTYKPLSIDLLGNVYLSFNDVIEVTNLQENTYRTYSLNNNHEYNGTLFNTITAPALTETEEKYKYETEDKTYRRKTAAEIDKANGRIALINQQIGDRSQKEATITEEIDSIELRISNIEDLTKEVIGNNPITLENCLHGNLLQLKIRGNNTVFDQLYPANDLYPADNLYPRNGDSILHIYTDNKCIDTVDKWENGYIGNNGQEYHSDPYNSAMIISDYIEINQLSGYISLEDTNYKFYQVYCYTQDKIYINTSTSTFIRKQEGTINFRTNTKYIRVVIVNKDFHYNETGYENNYPEITADEILEAKPMLTYTNEKIDYVQYYNKQIDLKIREVLRQYSSTIYDEFIYDYEDEEQRAKVIRRVGVTSGGTLYPLAEEVIEPLEIEDIIVIKGKNILDLNFPYVANMYARYVELNGFTNQFATTYEVESAIIQLANRITLLLREKVNKEEVIAELNLEISEGKGIVRITGNHVIIHSDYFQLEADGTVTATNGEFRGKIVAIEGKIGNLELSGGYLYKDFTVGGVDYQSGLYIPADDSSLSSIFLYAGLNKSNNTYNLKIGHNGVIVGKYITLNNDYGYLEMVYDDTGKVAMALKNTQLEFRLNDNANTLFGRMYRQQNDLTIGILGALGFCIRDELHSRNLYNADPRQGNVPYHYFTGEMWMDRDLDGTFVQVAQSGDWSDERLKKDIKDSETNALDIVDKIQFKQFTWDETAPKKGVHVDIGIIAQDIEKINNNYVEVAPRIYNGEKQDLLSIDVLNLLTTTTKAVQELHEIINKQQEEIDALKEELNKLKGGNN